MSTILQKIKIYWQDLLLIGLICYSVIGVSVSLIRTNRNTKAISNLSESIAELSHKLYNQNTHVIDKLDSIESHLSFIDSRFSTNYNWFFADDANIKIKDSRSNKNSSSQSSNFDNKHIK